MTSARTVLARLLRRRPSIPAPAPAPAPAARIRLGGVGGVGRDEIEINGTRVEHGVHAVELRTAVGEVPELVLSLWLREGLAVDVDDVAVTVPPATRDVLLALGWRAPDAG